MAPKAARTLATKRSLEAPPAAIASTKRSKTEVVAAAEPVKKSKSEAVDPALQAVVDALQIVDVPADCRAMLIAMAPCLLVPSADRQELPTMFVNMIGEALKARQKVLEDAICEEGAKLADVEQSRTVRDTKLVDAEAAFSNCTAEVNKSIEVADTKAKDAMDAKKTVEEMVKKQNEFEVSLAGAGDEKVLVERALSENLLPLKQGCEPSDAKVHGEVLVPLASRIKLDESLVVALPGFCAKPSSERGTFDTMIVEQLEKEMRQKVSALAQLLADSEASRAEHAAAVEVARSNAEKAAEQQNAAATHLEAAKASQLQASIAVEEAKAAVLAFEPEHRQATKTLNDKQVALQSFTSDALASYEALRSKADTTTVVEEQVAEAPCTTTAVEEQVVEAQ